MYNRTDMSVDFATVRNAQDDVNATSGRISSHLSDLRQFLAPLVSTWQGAASADYQALQKRWDTSAADLHAVLVQTGQLLGQSLNGYTTTERANASAWG